MSSVPIHDRPFCFSSEADYLESDLRSPTDTSEDSVEVKVSPISLKNKRKCAEPRRVQDILAGPLKKRVCLQVKSEPPSTPENYPFRPWSIPSGPQKKEDLRNAEEEALGNEKKTSVAGEVEEEDQPVALVKKRVEEESVVRVEAPRVPLHPHMQRVSSLEAERLIAVSADAFPKLRKEQRNYKNMTRERRIEANARERTRVHTISAAFDTLRRSVPSYSHNQKLSKLSVLRIACSYIMTLSSMVGADDVSTPSTSECVDVVSRTIQREGKLRKKKDEGD